LFVREIYCSEAPSTRRRGVRTRTCARARACRAPPEGARRDLSLGRERRQAGGQEEEEEVETARRFTEIKESRIYSARATKLELGFLVFPSLPDRVPALLPRRAISSRIC